MRLLSTTGLTTLAAGALLYAAASGPAGTWAAERWPFAAGEDPTTRTAIALRCGEVEEAVRPACERNLEARFASGESSPDAIVRLHCTQFRNVWDLGDAPDRPAFCNETGTELASEALAG